MLKQTNKHQYHVNIMHRGKVNKTRYDDSRKLIKQTGFIVKNLGGNLPKKQFIIVKRSFRFSTKPLYLNSTIPVDELTAETFYYFRTSEFFNIMNCFLGRFPTRFFTMKLVCFIDFPESSYLILFTFLLCMILTWYWCLLVLIRFIHNKSN